MKIYEFAQNLKNDSDVDKMLLVVLMLNFSEHDIHELRYKYGSAVIEQFEKYL